VRVAQQIPFSPQRAITPAPVSYPNDNACKFHLSLPGILYATAFRNRAAARAEADAGHYSPRRGSGWCESTGRRHAWGLSFSFVDPSPHPR
jgi:hypothetical protein